ncbi:MAG: uracil-DNA glycosylase [Pirellulales bacterium]|nr:uracil-DNA glycosylase [Pirellulales bacterium]
MHDPATLKTLVRQQLESLAAAGVEALPHAVAASPAVAPSRTPASPGRPASPQQEAVMLRAKSSQPAKSSAVAVDDATIAAAPSLEVLRELVADCTRCSELATTRTQTVFGVGNPRAKLCLLGEAPGADEDRLGEPFVGRAGQLLTKILEACKLTRDEVYILNVLKCRPPGNRNPEPDEACRCRPYLDRQLALIDPGFICCLGAVAAKNLLDTQEAIGKLRGKVLDYRGIKVVCTYHPAYLLRNPAAKGATWDDMKLLLRTMGRPVD